ncbi:IS110 family transposase [Fervidobacterium pennivorans subsp. shakshaketiis]|uniref:IS110 family transposase n=1 Tax=Fervidobacterium pennivorans TaxID=93466 RepID=UPI00355C4ADF
MDNFPVFVGIDVSKDKFNVCAISNPSSIIFESSFDMSQQGFSSFANKLSAFPKQSIIIAMESTGCYHLNLLAFLSSNDFACAAFNPLTVKNFASLRKTKTDKIDARIIATALFYLQHQIPSSAFVNSELRDIVRARENIIHRIAKVKGNIEKLLNVLFPELERVTNIYSDTILNLLSHFPSAKAIQKARNLDIFFSKDRGRNTKLTAQKLKELANNSIAQYWPMKEKILVQNIKELQFLQQQLEEYDKMMKEYCECSAINLDIEILTSIPGIGENSAMHFLAEVGDISRFSTYKKLIAYCGLDPSIAQSGKSKVEGHISKRGNAHLRRILWLMAVSVVIHNEYFRTYYERKRQQGIPYKKAIMSVVHKLLRTLYAMLRKKEKFNIDYAISHSKQKFNFA